MIRIRRIRVVVTVIVVIVIVIVVGGNILNLFNNFIYITYIKII